MNKQWNKGLRLDYTLVSKNALGKRALESFILKDFSMQHGDHCPVGLTVEMKK
jgi:exonuclease III